MQLQVLHAAIHTKQVNISCAERWGVGRPRCPFSIHHWGDSQGLGPAGGSATQKGGIREERGAMKARQKRVAGKHEAVTGHEPVA